MSVSTVRLRQDQLSDVLELGTVHIFEVTRIEQKGKGDHPVNPGGAGGKYLEGEETQQRSAPVADTTVLST